MLGEQVTGEDGRDLLGAVERDVHCEVYARHSGDLAHIVVDGIALGHAPGRVRMTDPPSVVQHEHRFETGEPRGDHFRPPAEPGKEVRLDETGRDPHVGADPRAIQVHGHMSGGLADVDE